MKPVEFHVVEGGESPLTQAPYPGKLFLNQSSQIIHSGQVCGTKPLFDCFWLPALLKAGINVNYI